MMTASTPLPPPRTVNREPLKRIILDALDASPMPLSVGELVTTLRRSFPACPISIHDTSVRLALADLVDSGEVRKVPAVATRAGRSRADRFATTEE